MHSNIMQERLVAGTQPRRKQLAFVHRHKGGRDVARPRIHQPQRNGSRQESPDNQIAVMAEKAERVVMVGVDRSLQQRSVHIAVLDLGINHRGQYTQRDCCAIRRAQRRFVMVLS